MYTTSLAVPSGLVSRLQSEICNIQRFLPSSVSPTTSRFTISGCSSAQAFRSRVSVAYEWYQCSWIISGWLIWADTAGETDASANEATRIVAIQRRMRRCRGHNVQLFSYFAPRIGYVARHYLRRDKCCTELSQ